MVHRRRIPTPYRNVILTADVGGTNLGVALIENDHGSFRLLMRRRRNTASHKSIESAINEAIAEFRQEPAFEQPDLVCVSAAGPVKNGHVFLTNVGWTIDQRHLTEALGIHSHVINDFQAVCYGLPLIDTNDSEQVHTLAHPDGTRPEPYGHMACALGAGTGLGQGFVVDMGGHYEAFPTEGGHVDYAAFDERSNRLRDFLSDRLGTTPGRELVISGQGITNILAFALHTGSFGHSDEAQRIGSLPKTEQPAAVSSAASDGDKVCGDVIRLFVDSYARAAQSSALHYIPHGGLFLAGGIAAKNLKFIEEHGRFMEGFRLNYQVATQAILSEIPVFVLKDYDISLYGAAHAAISKEEIRSI